MDRAMTALDWTSICEFVLIFTSYVFVAQRRPCLSVRKAPYVYLGANHSYTQKAVSF